MKKFILLICTILAAWAVCLFVGCNKELSKEEIACKMICYVAEEYEVEPSSVLLKSGSLTEEEDGDYFANFLVVVNGYEMYFSGTYYVETEVIEYNDVTSAVEVLGAGPNYYNTESFNVDKVNDELKKEQEK